MARAFTTEDAGRDSQESTVDLFHPPLVRERLLRELVAEVRNEDGRFAACALSVGRLVHPHLDVQPYVHRLDAMVGAAEARITFQTLACRRAERRHTRLLGLTHYLFHDEDFSPSDDDRDPRDTLLHDVLERRVGSRVGLGILYLELARRVGLPADALLLPGHFLVRCSGETPEEETLVIDPFESGTILTPAECRLVRQEYGSDEFDPLTMPAASKTEILVQLLLALKHVYVRLRSFPQAHVVTEVLLAIDPSAQTELRDRGLLAYHLNEYASALRDLQSYLTLSPEERNETRDQRQQIADYVKTLRRRVAAMN